MHIKKLTLSKILGPYTIDKVMNGKEHQLIKRNKLYSLFEKHNLLQDLQTKIILKMIFLPYSQDLDSKSENRFVKIMKLNVFRHDEPNVKMPEIVIRQTHDLVDIDALMKVFEDSGIKEDLPLGNKFMDFSLLSGPSIRVFNKITTFMEENKIEDVLQLFKRSMVQKIEVESPKKKALVQVISVSDFTKQLKNLKILKFHEDLDDEFISFLELSEDQDDILMVKKLKLAIRKTRESEYFQSFGLTRRQGFPDPNDSEHSPDRSKEAIVKEMEK